MYSTVSSLGSALSVNVQLQWLPLLVLSWNSWSTLTFSKRDHIGELESFSCNCGIWFSDDHVLGIIVKKRRPRRRRKRRGVVLQRDHQEGDTWKETSRKAGRESQVFLQKCRSHQRHSQDKGPWGWCLFQMSEVKKSSVWQGKQVRGDCWKITPQINKEQNSVHRVSGWVLLCLPFRKSAWLELKWTRVSVYMFAYVVGCALWVIFWNTLSPAPLPLKISLIPKANVCSLVHIRTHPALRRAAWHDSLGPC